MPATFFSALFGIEDGYCKRSKVSYKDLDCIPQEANKKDFYRRFFATLWLVLQAN
jgi:hypothetical protein